MSKLYRFDNGLRLVLSKSDALSVSFGMFIKAGCAYEEADYNGISHFIEHTMFKGTERRNAFEISDTMDRIGGQINAYTSKEATCYYTKTLAGDENLETSFDLLSDMLFCSKFDQQELDKEKGVVFEEISMVEDTPDDKVFDCVAKAAYGDSTLAQTILGSHDNVASFTKADIDAYMDKRYTPNKIVLSVCGSFDEEKTVELAKKYFVDRFVRSNTPDLAVKKHKSKSAFIYENKKIEQSHLVYAFPSVSYDSKDVFKVMMLSSALGGGMTSRLFQSIREDKGLCYSVYSYLSCYNTNGHIVVYVGVNPKNVEATARAVKDEIDKIKNTKLSQVEFDRTKAQMISSYVFAQENQSSVLSLSVKQLFGLNKLISIEKIVEDMKAIELCDVNELIDKSFDTSDVSAALLGPDNFDILSIMKE